MTQAANLGALGTNVNTSGALNAASLTGTIPTASLPAGAILQVVSATKTDSYVGTSATFTDVPGLSVTLTPRSSSSKFLVIASVTGAATVQQDFFAAQLVRNSTPISIGDAFSDRIRATSSFGYTQDSGGQLVMAMSTLDAPATTSALTYKVQISNSNHGSSAVYVNRSQSDESGTRSRTTSTITVMEVAG